MSENERGFYIGLTRFEENEQIPAWKALDEVCRKWAALSGHENDWAQYQKIQEMYTLK
jgi:hypothetical protein